MACPRCQAERFAGMRFCGNCAAPLVVACQRCHADNPAENRFCGQCGALLGVSAEGQPSARYAAQDGELKQVTVLFCDVVESTILAERLGPESMHELIRWFIDTALEEVHRYGGTAPQFTGDGFMALFGAPLAHEDHVRRALLAALAIRDVVSNRSGAKRNRSAQELQIHMGIHTGLVVFGSVGGKLRMDPTAIGDPANIAARLQGAAAPGAIVISEETRQLARGYLRIEPLGPLTLKGKGQPITAHRLLGVSHRFVPDEAMPAVRPFVDRISEMAVLNDLVRPVAEGRGQVLGIVGEPGIGKSRLLAEFRDRLGDGMTWIEGRCLSYGTTIPYLIVLDLLRGLCRIGDDDVPETVDEKLRSTLLDVGMEPEQDAPLLLRLLGIETGTGDGSALSSPEAVKTKTLQLLCQLFINSSRFCPMVLVLEDLHWIDEVSDEFITFLADGVGGARILLLATYRPGYRSPWIDKSYAGQLPLRPLSPADSRDVVRSARADLEDPLTEVIVAKADGNPLFLEQLALHAGEARATGSVDLVPNTIRDVVMARIDRLPEEAKHLLQTAAVIGREFSDRLLRAVWRGGDPIAPHMRELTRLEFIQEYSDDQQAAYIFRHALAQETAYASLLESHRRRVHGIVGNAIETLYEGRFEEVVEQLVYHFGRSDHAEKTVDYAIQAAEKAQRRWANSEALAYFDEALRRLDAMPDTEANRFRRIDTVLRQAEVKFALGEHREQLEALEKIRAIVEESGDARRRATWHYWTGFLHSLTGSRSVVAIEHCRRAAAIASKNGLDELDGFIRACLAQAYVVAGELRAAIEAGEQALAIFEARNNLWWAGRTLWNLAQAAIYLGEWDTSLSYCEKALGYGDALDDLRLRTGGLYRTGSAHIQRGDIDRGLSCCAEALALNPIPYDVAMAQVFHGYGKIKAGHLDQGIAELREAIGWLERSGLQHVRLAPTLRLAEGYFRRGEFGTARELAEDVLATCRVRDYRYVAGLAHRLIADCVTATSPIVAQEHVDEALKIFDSIGARNDVAKTLVTRAVIYENSGELITARRMLEEAGALFEQLGTLDEPMRVKAALAALDRASMNSTHV